MRRIGLVGMIALMALGLTACPTAPPAGYSPPKIQNVQISPDPVRPGESLTMVLDIIDDRGIAGAFGRMLYTPTGTRLSVQGQCTNESAPQGDFRHVLVTVTCPIPEFASNGTWRLEVRVNDGGPLENLPGLVQQIPFEITGGTDDRTPPQLVQYETSPATIDQETPFTLTVRLRDDSGVTIGQVQGGPYFQFYKPFSPHSVFGCRTPVYTPVSETDTDVTLTCTPSNYGVGGRSEAGLHVANMPVYDALQQQGTVQMTVDVQPAP